jgi:DNA-binding Lrp family transcriptional regulator
MVYYDFDEFKEWLEEKEERKGELDNWEEFLRTDGEDEGFEDSFVEFSTEEFEKDDSTWKEYCRIVLEWKAEVD